MADEHSSSAIDVHLAEYKELKSEQRERIKARDNFVYLMLTVAAAIGFAASAHVPLQYPTLLLVPLASFILGWTHLMNDWKVSEIGRYLRGDLTATLQRCAGTEDTVLGWERANRGSTRRRHRKVMQVVVDLVVFCGSGAAAIFTYCAVNPTMPVIFIVVACGEAVALVVLAAEIVAHADFGRLPR
jgi:hypothetical protein